MTREEKTAAHGGVFVELPLGGTASDFNLEKAVCSHGLFMMAPNHWDPQSKTLRRPLRLDDHQETSYMVQIFHPPHSPHTLCVLVFGTDSLSPQQEHSLLSQVRRMLRLSVEENTRIMEFQEMHEKARERRLGRVFRSPTLFEDMVKCMLLCNCQWGRTLSMAQALCELQLELQHLSSGAMSKDKKGTTPSWQTTEPNHFMPKTPAGKESKRNIKIRKCSKKMANKFAETLPAEEINLKTSSDNISEGPTGKDSPIPSSDTMEGQKKCEFSNSASNVCEDIFFSVNDIKPIEETGYLSTRIGNFPSPRELASLDEKFLAKRCNLGYRAIRLINLAKEVVKGKIELRELECGTLSLSDYDNLAEKLRAINGFGPFTCANVLMCMGFYHVIPTDSETIRHLEQVHAKKSTIRTVQEDVEVIYGKYAPFQFLAYWSEVWNFYEEWFGSFSEMPHSHYKLITAANMRPRTDESYKGPKRMKLSMDKILLKQVSGELG